MSKEIEKRFKKEHFATNKIIGGGFITKNKACVLIPHNSKYYKQIMDNIEDLSVDLSSIKNMKSNDEKFIVKINDRIFNAFLYIKPALKILSNFRVGMCNYNKAFPNKEVTEKTSSVMLVLYTKEALIGIAELDKNKVEEDVIFTVEKDEDFGSLFDL